MADNMRTISSLTVNRHDELYKIIDMLNRTLKDRDLLFGLLQQKDGKMTVTVYDTAVSDPI